MYQPEIVPQSMVDTKTIVLKPRLDGSDIQLIGQRIKRRLFSRFGLKSKPEDIRLLSCEAYFEPYLIIGGKYALDYCKEHVFGVNVDEKTTKILVGGQEFESEQRDPNVRKRVVRVKGEEHVHHERQTYFILDRMKREVQPEKLPISPFDIQKENLPTPDFKSIQISDEMQIEFLKTKIARRPACVAEIIKEVFEITERTIAHYPMYQLTFENMKSQKDATITINGITGEIILNGTKKLATKTIVAFPKSTDIQPVKIAAHQTHTLPAFDIGYSSETNKAPARYTNGAPEGKESNEPTPPTAKRPFSLGFPAKISNEAFVRGDEETVAIGDVEVPSGATINRNLRVRGTLRIGDNCRIHGKLEATKDVSVGANTVIHGNVISGGNVALGSCSVIAGSLQAAGYVKISEHATIEGGLRSNPTTEKPPGIQLEVVEVEELR